MKEEHEHECECEHGVVVLWLICMHEYSLGLAAWEMWPRRDWLLVWATIVLKMPLRTSFSVSRFNCLNGYYFTDI